MSIPLASMADVKSFKSIPTTAETEAAELLDAASEYMERRIARPLELVERTEYLTPRGHLVLPRAWPIETITALELDGTELEVLMPDGSEDDQETLVPPHRLWIESRVNPIPVTRRGCIKLTYEAGYDPIPKDLNRACCMVTHLLLQERARIGDGAKTFGQETIEELLRNSDDYQVIRDTMRRYAKRAGRTV